MASRGRLRHSRRFALAVCTSLLLAGCAADRSTRPMSQMDGDCANYRLDVQRELALKQGASVNLQAVAAEPASAPFAVLERRLDVALHAQPSVAFRLPPQRRSDDVAQRHAGLLQLRVPSDGEYKISTAIAAWVDVIDEKGERVRDVGFERQKRCEGVFKAVVFPLRAAHTYTLQISASRTPALALFIVPR